MVVRLSVCRAPSAVDQMAAADALLPSALVLHVMENAGADFFFAQLLRKWSYLQEVCQEVSQPQNKTNVRGCNGKQTENLRVSPWSALEHADALHTQFAK